jgi:mono/diheme cytochrome c family protein
VSTENKIVLASVAAVFIAFALASAMLIPRWRPSYPGKHLSWFLTATAVLFVSMMLAVEFFAVEDEAEAEHEATPTETQGETSTEPAEPTEPAPGGNAEQGKEVFASAGCGGCHTFADAGSSGSIGPNLDESTVTFEAAEVQIRDGGGGMPAFVSRLSEEEIANVAAYVVEARGNR